MKCSNCSKGIMYGHNVSHSKRRTVRTFKPNLHVAKLEVDGSTKKLKLCTKCLRSIKKSLKPAEKLAPEILANPLAV
ncbi:MAG TPA: 50S ribosomal protein L28 [Candidatus Saccharimonadales bacterium]|nr:50S ribosomal protein L28 [Candidatus Saccharimonadales bacterium]